LIIFINQHPQLSQYLGQVKNWVLTTKSEQQVRSEEFKQQTRLLINQGRELVHNLKMEKELNQFFKTSHELIENIQNDSFIELLRKQAGIVRSDLSYIDSEGKTQVDMNMLTKLQAGLLPILADALKYIPIPRISVVNRKREFWVDNIVLCTYDLVPDNIKFHLETHSNLSTKDIEITGNATRLYIELDRILMELKDMSFYFNKKTFPEFTDQGTVTLRFKGQGAHLLIGFKLSQHPESSTPILSEGFSRFTIREMALKFDKSKLTHDVLVPNVTKLFKKRIQREIEEAVEKNLTNFISQLGEKIAAGMTGLGKSFIPEIPGLETAREILKSSDMAQIHGKRKEKLIE